MFALSGINSNVSVFTRDVVSSFDDDLQLDESFIPAIYLNQHDHRGRKVRFVCYIIMFEEDKNE